MSRYDFRANDIPPFCFVLLYCFCAALIVINSICFEILHKTFVNMVPPGGRFGIVEKTLTMTLRKIDTEIVPSNVN